VASTAVFFPPGHRTARAPVAHQDKAARLSTDAGLAMQAVSRERAGAANQAARVCLGRVAAPSRDTDKSAQLRPGGRACVEARNAEPNRLASVVERR